MVDINDHISIDPEKLNGKPCIKGTRIPISTILANLEEGLSILDIIEEFDQVTEDDVKAIIKYARLIISEELPIGTIA